MRRLLPVLLAIGTAAFAPVAPFAHDVTGNWNFVVVTENGTGRPVVNIKQVRDSVSGTYSSNAMGSRSITGIVRNDSLIFVFSANAAGESLALTYAARIVTADSLNGYVDFAGQGGAPFTATRQKR